MIGALLRIVAGGFIGFPRKIYKEEAIVNELVSIQMEQN